MPAARNYLSALPGELVVREDTGCPILNAASPFTAARAGLKPGATPEIRTALENEG